MTSASPAPRGVYLITPDEPDTARLLARTAPLLAAGATWLQYRNKSASDALRREQATALQALCAAHGVPLIVNDDPELAQAIGAAGVHLGGTDGDIGAARSLLGPDAIIGASCYDQLANAERAVAAGASYVAFGAFFPTTTKVTSSRAHPDLLRQSAALGVPRVAIGGLSPDNVGPIIDAGADLLAVVSGIYAAQDPVATQRAYLARFDTQQ
ncbi:thiamine phosphate synthase [Stenotrophomonas indicatrix]|jgi:thiamine-phosphate pyrophosphorylase|uniref:Thiamine-phosphate synthase n=2 Tax=Stenotrophomonas indicatrix TaxID=2045451 RepID=A0ABT8QCG8_9GAMM|nr:MULTISPECIES: thiamine phosphate synthase [Stenotrophomonas]EVT73701.1 thiamine-phosphate pyrophosphorylase [Stenotrophomonas maltophilia 5BA-I-2]OJH80846.1 MAG: thiamine-phosphate diphosphorylase [Stenotrophomonas maltophilia]MBA0097509.1 thiamine phosphate synthase [Stenotrophomonas indicatrix]MDH6331246.1 thiamine-phosphate pyrophosphorylase [Stenotrophomonas sp. 1278]MDN8661205.1 thiamine phosphate synthase [Stenotrophomonas indicatrix]